mgnify:CR=1 FL=1
MGFSETCLLLRCLAVPVWKDEDFGKSAPFFYLFPIMKNLVQRFFLLCLFVAFSGLAMAADIPNNTIYYTSDGGKIINPYKTDVFGANIVSNTYTNGQGIITFDGEVTSIGEKAFMSCSFLTSITIPNSVTSIGNSAIYNCNRLTSITIPNSVTSIGYDAFNACTGLTSIVVDVRNANYDSRDNCNAIIETSTNTLLWSCKNTVIPNSVTSIGNYAFYNCYDLTSITIPNSVTNIGEGAFMSCPGLTSITIPNSVTSIRENTFYGCSGLTLVTIPNSVTNIGRNAFSGCSNLTSITIPNSVTSIGTHIIMSCLGITSVSVEQGNANYDSRSNCNAIIETATNTLISGCKNTIIPNSVTSIGNEAFRVCFGLTSITIPNSVTSIGNDAFASCSGLTSITIPNSVTSIGERAFNLCERLTSVTNLSTTPQSINIIHSTPTELFTSFLVVRMHTKMQSIGIGLQS